MQPASIRPDYVEPSSHNILKCAIIRVVMGQVGFYTNLVVVVYIRAMLVYIGNRLSSVSSM